MPNLELFKHTLARPRTCLSVHLRPLTCPYTHPRPCTSQTYTLGRTHTYTHAHAHAHLQRYPRVPAGLGLESESEDPDGQDTHASGDEEQGCGHCACGGSVSEEDELEGEGEGLLGPRSRSEGEEAMCAAGGVAGSGLEVRPSKAQENGACSKEKAKEEQGSENLGTGLEGKDQGQAQQQQQQFQSQAPDQEEAQGLRTAPAMVAFDGMLVPLSVLPHLPMVGPLVAKVLKRAEQLQEKQEQEQLQLEQQQRHQQSMATLGMSVAA
eukprot:1159388-Pelagomonas_calceolata.AAC.29